MVFSPPAVELLPLDSYDPVSQEVSKALGRCKPNGLARQCIKPDAERLCMGGAPVTAKWVSHDGCALRLPSRLWLRGRHELLSLFSVWGLAKQGVQSGAVTHNGCQATGLPHPALPKRPDRWWADASLTELTGTVRGNACAASMHSIPSACTTARCSVRGAMVRAKRGLFMGCQPWMGSPQMRGRS